MRSDPVTTTCPTIQYRPSVPKPVRRKAKRGNQTDKGRFTVTSDWPNPVPATGGEVAVIETFLSETVSRLLAGIEQGQ